MPALQTSISRPPRDEKREAILRIAYQAFLTDGYAATSMSEIARQVGGSKATLYNYFKSKEELFTAVVDEKCQDIQDMVFDAALALDDFPKALTQLGDRFLHVVLREDSIATFRLITGEAARFPELGRAFYSSGPSRSKEVLADFFRRAVADGHLGAHDPKTMAGRFFELCKGELHQRKLWNASPEPSEAEIRANVIDAVRVFLAAYGRSA
jgi:AcrR family transcriptional regulator